MQSCNAEDLARLVREGDVEALALATDCFGERLLAIGRRYCRNNEEAHDAVQDALLNAMEHQTDYRGDGPVVSWLMRMVVNACQRQRRGQKNDSTIHDTVVALRADQADPERAAAQAELAATLGRALMNLSPQDRAIIMLSDIEGWKGPQIAAKMGMSPAALRARLSRSRGKLRTELDHAALSLLDL
ncbi:MAG: RNA polymerase sigma-70 factor (ECF subfamily) [Kiritimatiellia bacterium]|jgi:RNA polymerase sigma-70 factor (ECF subfamily)